MGTCAACDDDQRLLAQQSCYTCFYHCGMNMPWAVTTEWEIRGWRIHHFTLDSTPCTWQAIPTKYIVLRFKAKRGKPDNPPATMTVLWNFLFLARPDATLPMPIRLPPFNRCEAHSRKQPKRETGIVQHSMMSVAMLRNLGQVRWSREVLANSFAALSFPTRFCDRACRTACSAKANLHRNSMSMTVQSTC